MSTPHNIKYKTLTATPPKISVVAGAREVIFTTVSCMCDNIHQLTFRKNDEGDFRVSGNGSCLSNWQMKGEDYKTDLEWAADDQKWDNVIDIINTGTAVVSSVRSR